MKIQTTGRKVTLKKNFLELVDKKLDKLDKFFPNEVQAQVTVTVEKDWQTVEITIKDGGVYFRSEKTAPQMEIALELAVEKLESQIIKNKNKIAKKAKSSYKYDIFYTDDVPEEEYHIARRKVFALEEQTVEDAILEMNMLDHTFFMFKDVQTGDISVVYKRKDGKYGLLLPK